MFLNLPSALSTPTDAQVLRNAWISKAAAKQRMGRAGRTQPGHAYRLYEQAKDYGAMKDYTDPQVGHAMCAALWCCS